jgi:GT2 family glycosyltransferase
MIKKECFELIHGFDENFINVNGDVDFCLKLINQGYKILFTPGAELYYYESNENYKKNQKNEITIKDNRRLMDNWRTIILKGDPYYNPNLSKKIGDFSIRI